jgi:adenylate kinase family enzyme
MEGKKGTISKLLYQIRSTLEKKGVNIESLSLKKCIYLLTEACHLNEMYVSQKIGQKIPQFDSLNQKFFLDRLNKTTKAQKEVNLEKHLEKFELHQIKQEEVIKKLKEDDLKREVEVRDERNSQMKNEAMRFHDFQQKFDQDGIEKWKENMIVTKERERKDLEFMFNECVKIQKSVIAAVKGNELECKSKIEKFEKGLLKQKDLLDENEETTETYPKNDRILALTSGMIEGITDKILKNQTTKTERDRRRRKIIVEQSKAQLEIENKRREEQLKSKLFKQSNQEKQLTYESYRIDQMKNVFRENRELRKYNYEEQKEGFVRYLHENEEQFLNQHRDYFERDMNKEEQRLKELEISLNQKVRSKNSEVCKEMVNLLVDIVEEAFVYQQINDVNEIDTRVWREWTQLFINNQSLCDREMVPENRTIMSHRRNEASMIEDMEHEIKNLNNSMLNQTIQGSNYNATEGKTFYIAAAPYTVIDKTLDDCEFLDYINLIGQWSKGIIPISAFTKLNLQDIMTDTTALNSTNTLKNNFKSQKEKVEEFKEEDPDNLIIPNENVKNVFLGDLIDLIIDIKYQDEYKENSRDFIFKSIPIKLAIIGQDFAGKKTQAKILSENYPFKVYCIDDLLTEALNIYKRLESPVDDIKAMRTTQRLQMKEEREYDESKYRKLKELVENINTILKNGGGITDDIYVDLLIEFIKIDFPEKSEEDIANEAISRVNFKEQIKEELEKNDEENKDNRPQLHLKTEQELRQKLMKAELDATQGIVLVNFPNTYNQAKLLERKLSSYVPENEKQILQANILKENISLIIDKSPFTQPPQKLLSGGLDYIFYLDVPFRECIRRAIGRRINPNTNEVYHLHDNPPDTTSNICENLTALDDPRNTQCTLVTRDLSFKNTIDYMIDFYKPFGFEKKNIKLFHQLDGFRHKDIITQELIEYITEVAKINEELDDEVYNKHCESEAGQDNPSIIINSLADFTVDNNTRINFNNISNNMEIMNTIEDDDYTRLSKRKEQIKKLLNKNFSEVLLNLVIKLLENYVNDCKDIFRFIRMQREYISTNYDIICQKFIVFLKRPSNKQAILLNFQKGYNKFLDTYPDLTDDPQSKEEHHQAIDDMNDKIFDIIEKRKKEAVEERKNIMTSGLTETEMEKYYLNLEKLFQAEVDKFIASLQVIRDFYHNLDNRPLVELPFSTIDLVKEEQVVKVY